MEVSWSSIVEYEYLWDPYSTEVRNFDGEYHFVYPFRSVREELQAFPELRQVAREKLIQLGADMSEVIKELAAKKKLIDRVPDSDFRKAAMIFYKVVAGVRLERLQKEYAKFEFIGKVITGNKQTVAFDELLETARNVSIIETVERFTKVRKSGSKYVCNCLFHEEDTPSMVLYPDGASFHCFGCGKSGDSLDIVMHKMGVGMKEGIKILLN